MSNIHSSEQQVASQLSLGVTLANSTQNGAAIDTRGYTAAKVIFATTTGLTTTSQVTVDESDDGSTNWVAVAGATLAAAVVASTTNALYVIGINLKKGRKRFIRVNSAGTGTNGNAYGIVELYNAPDMPVAQTNTAIAV